MVDIIQHLHLYSHKWLGIELIILIIDKHIPKQKQNKSLSILQFNGD